MKIMICGSMHFAKEMLEAKSELEKAGHKVIMPGDVHNCVVDPNLKDEPGKNYERELRQCIERDLLKDGLRKIEESDAVLFLNKDKNDIAGYMGASGLMELGVATYLNKKIFLLNEVDKNQKYAIEINLIQPIILNGDLNKIG
jgi:hypothetical protein